MSAIKRRQANKPRDTQIAALYAEGDSQYVIARKLGIHQATVQRSLKRADIKRP